VIAYIEQHKHVSPKLDERITDHHGHIMGDHHHLSDMAEQTGRADFDIERSETFVYSGQLNRHGVLMLD
jgi:hypothetical protein